MKGANHFSGKSRVIHNDLTMHVDQIRIKTSKKEVFVLKCTVHLCQIYILDLSVMILFRSTIAQI